jgi:hypothetical protein
MRVFRCGTGQFDDATRSRRVWARFGDPRSSMTTAKPSKLLSVSPIFLYAPARYVAELDQTYCAWSLAVVAFKGFATACDVVSDSERKCVLVNGLVV